MTSDASGPAALAEGTDLYALLGTDRGAAPEEIRKAYRKKALQLHPDKHPPERREEATRRFQGVSLAFGVLSDPARRARYDRTGRLDDLGSSEDPESLAALVAEMFRTVQVTPEMIDEFFAKHRGSAEERRDILTAYSNHKGDMNYIQQVVMGAEVDSEDRYVEIIDAAIAAGEVPDFPKHASTNTPEARAARRRKAEREASQARKAKEKVEAKMSKRENRREGDGGGEAATLQELIAGRAKRRFDSIVADIEAKYTEKKGERARRRGRKA
ncbi:MAG: hypothetical protein BJ554DRAFT_3793 [Olpidium bornovanus]|uniref:J domain-containing protein n=1 Tax=Olpidium bornovanus TaxID=278681 RepID=A0A8H7ZNT0_9FUNG|nr:MAG: hypothetical protein BJ554DRAFT_3793 [Olpidium bornovanus]